MSSGVFLLLSLIPFQTPRNGSLSRYLYYRQHEEDVRMGPDYTQLIARRQGQLHTGWAISWIFISFPIDEKRPPCWNIYSPFQAQQLQIIMFPPTR